MKMVIAIIYKYDEDDTVKELNDNGLFVTKLATIGGFSKIANTIIMIVCDDECVSKAIEVIKSKAKKRKENFPVVNSTPSTIGPNINPISCTSIPYNVGGCTLFVVDVLRFEKY